MRYKYEYSVTLQSDYELIPEHWRLTLARALREQNREIGKLGIKRTEWEVREIRTDVSPTGWKHPSLQAEEEAEK